MKTESDEFKEDVGVVGLFVIVQWWRLVGYDSGILRCEIGEILGAKCGLDEDYDPVFRMKDIVQAIYIDDDGASILGRGGIEDISVRTRTEIWQNCHVAFGREALNRSYISVVMPYLSCDVARTGKVVIPVLRIRMA